MPPTDLAGSVAVIAGGGKNLGGLLSRTLAADGARILVHYNSDASREEAEATAEAVVAAGSEAELFRGDLTTGAAVEELFAAAKARFGRVDVAVNTVGRVLKKPFVETTEAEFDAMSAINAKAGWLFIRQAGIDLADGGKIVSLGTSLLAGFTGLYSTYAGGKAPLEHYTRAAAKEFGERGISVTTVAPGPMDTPFFYPAESDEAVAFHRSQAMNGELTKIEDIVPVIRFLVTDGWWITGQTLFPNGGYTTR